MKEILNKLLQQISIATNTDLAIVVKAGVSNNQVVSISSDIKLSADERNNLCKVSSKKKKEIVVLEGKDYESVHTIDFSSNKTCESFRLILLNKKKKRTKPALSNLNNFNKILHYLFVEECKQQEVIKSAERFRAILETLDDFIFILDNKGNISFVNKSGAILLEYIPEELLNKHFLFIIDEADKPNVAKSFRELLKVNSVINFEAVLKTKYGKSIVFEINARSNFENDKLESVVGIGRDITTRKIYNNKLSELNNKLIEANRLVAIERDRAKQRISVLEELNRLKNEFVSSISHEFRTPLASIIGFAETIDSDPHLPDSTKKEFNAIILSEAKRLAKLINDVLDVSKIESGKIVLNKQNFNLVKVIQNILAQISQRIKEKNIFLSVDISDDEIIIFADEERIKQVFENILDNAIKFNKKDGRITVFVQSLYKEVEIIISDTGVGIPQKDLPFIYQKFYRVERPNTETQGTGLGLSIAKQVVDLHKGLINIKSDVNQGTTVIIKFPKVYFKDEGGI